MNKETKLMVRLNDSLKKEAEETLKSLGLDLSTAMRLFIVKMANINAIPLIPDEDTLINAILMGDYSKEEIALFKKDARSDYQKVREQVPYLRKLANLTKKK